MNGMARHGHHPSGGSQWRCRVPQSETLVVYAASPEIRVIFRSHLPDFRQSKGPNERPSQIVLLLKHGTGVAVFPPFDEADARTANDRIEMARYAVASAVA